MNWMAVSTQSCCGGSARIATSLAIVVLTFSAGAVAAQDRVLGLDVSRWQGSISQTTWNNIYNVENRKFVFVRATRGGTTGVDHRQGGYPASDNDFFSLSQRYDDPHFVRNITQATNAGLYAGPYHFARLDVVESTPNTGGIANTGTDEANHFLEMAGAWMRPGYLLPVFDLESGDAERTGTEIAQFSIDFSNRIYDETGVRPLMYINGNYSSILQGVSPSLRDQLVEAYPSLWIARYAYQSNPNSSEVQTAHPKDTFSGFYGPWDDGGVEHPWAFWQYASSGRLNSFNNGNSNLDFNVAQGGMEFLKDHLVPALWTSDANGEWTSLLNWNSGTAPVAPIQAPGQLAPSPPLTLPAVRLPSVDDTVILDRPDADITVTLSTGTHNIRKLQVREALNITGGTLTVNYVPSPDSSPESVRFSSPVLLGDGATLNAHTIIVDATQDFAMDGTLAFARLDLGRHGSNPASMNVLGNMTLAPLDDTTAVIASTLGTGASGSIDLGGQFRLWQVNDGAADVDVAIEVPIINGTLTKAGAGTLKLTQATGYQGSIVVGQGTLMLDNLTIDDTADVVITAGSVLELNYAGEADLVASLIIDGVAAEAGTWGAPGSGADFTSPALAGSGLLLVPDALLPGDFNDDGLVNLADYALWRNQLGAPAGSLANDDSGEAIGTTQYAAWKANFGTGQAAAAASASLAAVPEPGSWAILLLAGVAGGIGVAGRRRLQA